jgi:hypothetical protein
MGLDAGSDYALVSIYTSSPGSACPVMPAPTSTICADVPGHEFYNLGGVLRTCSWINKTCSKTAELHVASANVFLGSSCSLQPAGDNNFVHFSIKYAFLTNLGGAVVDMPLRIFGHVPVISLKRECSL